MIDATEPNLQPTSIPASGLSPAAGRVAAASRLPPEQPTSHEAASRRLNRIRLWHDLGADRGPQTPLARLGAPALALVGAGRKPHLTWSNVCRETSRNGFRRFRNVLAIRGERQSRRKRDGASRTSNGANGFQDRRLRPLGHPPAEEGTSTHRPEATMCEGGASSGGGAHLDLPSR